MSNTRGVGHFVHWEGGCLLIGRSVGAVPLHAHYAIQVAFGSEPGIRFRSSDHEDWTTYTGAIIPSRHPHAMDATTVRASAVIFVEPETREGRALAERHLSGGIADAPDGVMAGVAPPLFTAWQEERTVAAIADAARRVVRALTGGVAPSVVSDERVLRAVSYINAHLDAPLTLGAIASEACLSPSRLRHLFVEETGMPLRPYILWRRFVRAWELVAQGASLSTAAHGAGFADASHLARTSRTMFGFPPSALIFASPLAPGPDTADAPPTAIGESPRR
jgi:AraC family transcriptional regulator